MLKIKNLLIENPYIQAPLAGYSDRAYRHLAIEHGCFLTTTEMISTEGLWRLGKNTIDLLTFADNEKIVCVQLFGQKPESYQKAADILLNKLKPAMIDINAGCPVKKVVKTGSGCAMMTDLHNTYNVIKALRSVIGNIPLSIKFRLGINREHCNYIEFADNALQSGVDVISMHSRFASDLYSGKADFNAFSNLRSTFKNATIFASGDVFDVDVAEMYLNTLKADGVLIARGGIGNPYIFEKKIPNFKERESAYSRHFELLKYYYGDEKAERLLRKFYSHYFKGGLKQAQAVK